MICINCTASDTRVTNSRASKKDARVWRRRQCPACATTFTTNETVVFEDNILISDQPFSIPRLAWSLMPHLQREADAAETAYWLARTIGEKLFGTQQSRAFDTGYLATLTYEALHAYNPTIGASYGLSHNIIKPVRSPGKGRPTYKRG